MPIMRLFLIPIFSLLLCSSIFASSFFKLPQYIEDINEEIPDLIDTHIYHNIKKENFSACIDINYGSNNETSQELIKTLLDTSLNAHETSRNQAPKLVPGIIVAHLIDYGFVFSNDCSNLDIHSPSRDLGINGFEILLDSTISDSYAH